MREHLDEPPRVRRRERLDDPVKPKKSRSTYAEMVAFRAAFYEIVKAQQPMTVRQVFYQASIKGVVAKDRVGYRKVKTDLIWMRKNDELPYEWIVDNTRSAMKPRSFVSVAEALNHAARGYRKDLWHGAGVHVEIWIEKDALSGVIYPVTARYDVALMVARGYSSITFLEDAADGIRNLPDDVPCFIYQFGDHDPSGVNAGEVIERTLRLRTPGCEIHFERVAVTSEQIQQWNLPTRPTKMSDPRAKEFGKKGNKDSVELDAIEPNRLRSLVQEVIERHLPEDKFLELKRIEDQERRLIRRMVDIAQSSS